VHDALIPSLDSPPHDLDVLLRHRLLPLLGEPFGGCASLVDVEVDHDPFPQPSLQIATAA
jgi:hypothetical protein